MAKIDYKNRSILLTATETPDGGKKIELRWDRYDNVLYVVNESGEYKRAYPAFSEGGFPAQKTNQLANWIPSQLPNDNALTITFDPDKNTIVCQFASPILASSLSLNNITITGEATINSYTIVGDSNSTVTLSVSNTFDSTEYTVTFLNVINIIEDTNTVSASATTPTPPNYETQIQQSAGVDGLNGFCNSASYGLGLTYISDGSFLIDNQQWMSYYGWPMSGIPFTQNLDIYIKPFNSDFTNVDLSAPGAKQELIDAISFTFSFLQEDNTPISLTEADLIGVPEIYNNGLDFILQIPENCAFEFQASAWTISETYKALYPGRFITFQLFNGDTFEAVSERIYINNNALQLIDGCD